LKHVFQTKGDLMGGPSYQRIIHDGGPCLHKI